MLRQRAAVNHKHGCLKKKMPCREFLTDCNNIFCCTAGQQMGVGELAVYIDCTKAVIWLVYLYACCHKSMSLEIVIFCLFSWYVVYKKSYQAYIRINLRSMFSLYHHICDALHVCLIFFFFFFIYLSGPCPLAQTSCCYEVPCLETRDGSSVRWTIYFFFYDE